MMNRIDGQVCRLGHDTLPFQVLPQLSSADSRDQSSAKGSLFGPTLKLKKGEIIVAGRNFGCGSNDQRSIELLKAMDVPCVIAASFARRFYRDAINAGLPVIECPEAFEAISSGEQIVVDFDRLEISCKRGIAPFQAYPDVISKILSSGGLIPSAGTFRRPRAFIIGLRSRFDA